MLFSSSLFIFEFLPVALLGWILLSRDGLKPAALAWVLTCSLVFYGWRTPIYLVLIVTSILVNFTLGLRVAADSSSRKSLLILGIVANLLLLGYFKYAAWIVRSINSVVDLGFTLAPTELPLAISFFTIQQIAYLVDTYRSKEPERGLLRYAMIVVFFPHLIAGPIVRLSEFLPQMTARWPGHARRARDIMVGASIFCFGLAKKTILADRLGDIADTCFASAHQQGSLAFLDAWIGVLGYTFQIYFDFSGYSDMAIGLSQMFGFKLPVNFNSPYKATSIVDFWRRWHITLSSFLRDYVYIALGGNRLGEARRYVNLFLTMLIGGLWHGADWTFVAWGALHGSYLTVNHLWSTKAPQRALLPKPLGALGSWALTFLAVVVAWVFFRAPSFGDAQVILEAMFGVSGLSLARGPLFGLNAVKWVAIGAAAAFFMPNLSQLFRRYRPAVGLRKLPRPTGIMGRLDWKPTLLWTVVTVSVFIIAVLRIEGPKAFIYFAF